MQFPFNARDMYIAEGPRKANSSMVDEGLARTLNTCPVLSRSGVMTAIQDMANCVCGTATMQHRDSYHPPGDFLERFTGHGIGDRKSRLPMASASASATKS